MAIVVKNIAGKTEQARRERICQDDRGAHNIARNMSQDFHGVFAVECDDITAAYYKGGRRYRKLDSAWVGR